MCDELASPVSFNLVARRSLDTQVEETNPVIDPENQVFLFFRLTNKKRLNVRKVAARMATRNGVCVGAAAQETKGGTCTPCCI